MVDGLAHYMGEAMFSYREFAPISPRSSEPDFVADLDQLTADRPPTTSARVAADLVMERLGSRLPGAPGLDEIADGRWRAAGGGAG